MVENIRKVATEEICAQRCKDLSTCEFYMWKVSEATQKIIKLRNSLLKKIYFFGLFCNAIAIYRLNTTLIVFKKAKNV